MLNTPLAAYIRHAPDCDHKKPHCACGLTVVHHWDKASYLATARHLREIAKSHRHTEAVSDCPHCSLVYAAQILEEFAEAQAALAESTRQAVEQDDQEPVTEEWLRSVGFKDRKPEFEIPMWSLFADGGVCRVRRIDTRWDIEWSNFNRHSAATMRDENISRGDVRQLCRALGINLKE
jgi:hypothetical protein